MKDFNDFKKEWPKIKAQLMDASQQAMGLVKKGEEKVVKFTKQGKLQVELTSCNLKKEHLYYQIGKEFVKGKTPPSLSKALTNLVDELEAVQKEEAVLRKRIKQENKSSAR